MELRRYHSQKSQYQKCGADGTFPKVCAADIPGFHAAGAHRGEVG